MEMAMVEDGKNSAEKGDEATVVWRTGDRASADELWERKWLRMGLPS